MPIALCYGGRDPYGTGVVRRRCYMLLCMYILCYGGRDPYCTGGVRRRCYIHIYIYREEGTRMARAECEDGAIYHIRRKGPVWHRRSAKTVL